MSYIDFVDFGRSVYSYLKQQGLVLVYREEEYKVINRKNLFPGELILPYEDIASSKAAMKKLLTVGWKEAFDEELDNRAR